MKIELRSNKDFWAGIMLIATGAASIFIARGYPFGSTMRMGHEPSTRPKFIIRKPLTR